MIPCSFDYLIYPYYPAYTMGCYQIVIKRDNGKQTILLFLCWFATSTIAQKAWKCNRIPLGFTGLPAGENLDN